MRLRTKFVYCDKHKPLFLGERRERQAEVFVEGGWGGAGQCSGGRCRLFPGRDFFVEEICSSEFELDWAGPP